MPDIVFKGNMLCGSVIIQGLILYMPIPLKKKRQYKIWFGSWPVIIVLCALSVWMVGHSLDMYERYRLNAHQLDGVREKQEALEARILFLDETVSRLQTKEGVEEAIRSRLPYAKEGEQVVLIVTENSSGTDVVPAEKDSTLWWRVWRFFE